MAVDKEFVTRLLKGDDTSWRAGKTIQELELELEKQRKIIYEYYQAANSMKRFLGYLSYDDHAVNANGLTKFAHHLNAADGEVFDYSSAGFSKVKDE
jgi:hypothetical protein